MLRRKWSLLCCCVWTLTCIGFWAASAQAAGFALYEWSARANGMGGAVIATQRPDASAVAYNPATMTEIDSAATQAGVTVITPTAAVRINGVETHTDDQTFAVPNAFYMQPLSDKVWFGIGEFTRFGLGTEYPQGWPGAASLYDVQFNSYSVQPTLAFKCSEDLSFAFGLEVLRADIDIKRTPTTGGARDMHITTDGYAIGGNFSVFYKITDELAAGFVARAPMKLTGDGNVAFAPQGAPVFYDQGVTMKTTLPDSYTLGLSYTPNEQWSFETDVIYTRWEQYKKMTYDFEGTMPDSVDEKDWKNVWRFQFGGEFKATDWLAIRAGYVWDQSPIRSGHEDYMLPANDRQLVTSGLGFSWDNWTLDLSYQYLWAKDRYGAKTGGTNVDFVDNHAHLIGTSIGYTF